MAVDQRQMDNIQHIPILAVFGRLTLDFRESKCFLQGPETLMEMTIQ